MSKIVIHDLEASRSLDAKAMQDIAGGMQSLKLQNAPNALKFKVRTSYEESKLVPGLILTPDLRTAMR